jgi:hypothetical protein
MAGRMTRAASLALLAGAAIAGPAAAQLPKPMTETELKAAGARQVTADELRRMLTGNTSYVVLLKNFGPGKTGGVIANYYRDARARAEVSQRAEGRIELVARGQQPVPGRERRPCRQSLLERVGSRGHALSVPPARRRLPDVVPQHAGQSGRSLG